MFTGNDIDPVTLLKDVFDSLSQGVFITDENLHVRSWNLWLVEHTGVPEDEVIGRALPDLAPDLSARNIIQYYQDALSGEARVLSQRFHRYLLPMSSGHYEYMPQSCRIVPLTSSGQIHGTITYIEDVTERILREDELRRRISALEQACVSLNESREWMATTLRSIGDAVIATDSTGKVTLMNTVAEQLTGWSAEEAIGQPFQHIFRIVNEHTREPVDDPVAKVLATGRIVGLANHTILLSKDGREVPIDDSGAPIMDTASGVWGAVIVFRDVTERRQHEEMVALSEERFKLAAQATGDVIWDWDLETAQMWWSDAYEDRFGERPEPSECYARWWISHVHPDDRAMVMRTSGAALASSGTTWSCEYRYLRSDSTYADVIERAFIQRDFRGEAKRIIGAMLDLSDRKAAEREREELLVRERIARKEAEEANQAKDEFLAVVSHELRTPLNAMLGWARVLQMNESPSKEILVRSTSALLRNVELQTKLVDDLLDTARVISGKLRVEMEGVNLLAVIERTLEIVRPAADAKGITIRNVVSTEDTLVMGDHQRLQQIIWNLLINAIKFTPQGGHVQLHLNRSDSHVEIIVEDTGQGIDSEFLPYVFDRFRQSDTSITRRHMGLGLGLALVRSLVELHGGEITANSAGTGQGATFNLRLPAGRAHKTTADTSVRCSADFNGNNLLYETQPGSGIHGARLLVLDDNTDTRFVLTDVLEKQGTQVHSFAQAAAMLAWLEKSTDAQWPDALICDIGLPDMDGYEALRQFRILEAKRFPESCSKRPAIALTAFAKPEDRTRALTAGYQAHLAKPMDPLELLATLAALKIKPHKNQPVAR